MKKGVNRLLLVVGGAAVGFVNGFLGAGGGILVVPLLHLLLRLNVKESHATAIFVILPLCVVSSVVYIISGVFDFWVGLPVFIGSIIGAVVGSFLLRKLKNNIIVYIFCFIIIIAGIEVILK